MTTLTRRDATLRTLHVLSYKNICNNIPSWTCHKTLSKQKNTNKKIFFFFICNTWYVIGLEKPTHHEAREAYTWRSPEECRERFGNVRVVLEQRKKKQKNYENPRRQDQNKNKGDQRAFQSFKNSKEKPSPLPSQVKRMRQKLNGTKKWTRGLRKSSSGKRETAPTKDKIHRRRQNSQSAEAGKLIRRWILKWWRRGEKS